MVDSSRTDVVRDIAEAYAAQLGPLLPVLHAVQERFGWIARTDVEVVADVLNLSMADVHGVVSFYHDFRTAPPPAQLVSLCRGEACQAVGAEGLVAEVRCELAGRPANDIELAEVFCLGNCALGPSGTVDGRLYGRLTSDRVADLLRAGDRP